MAIEEINEKVIGISIYKVHQFTGFQEVKDEEAKEMIEEAILS
ncbi:hypothetical protein [Clostridium sp. FP2]|nr:hypothetical protein [Clostridium sp. FP2]